MINGALVASGNACSKKEANIRRRSPSRELLVRLHPFRSRRVDFVSPTQPQQPIAKPVNVAIGVPAVLCFRDHDDQRVDFDFLGGVAEFPLGLE